MKTKAKEFLIRLVEMNEPSGRARDCGMLSDIEREKVIEVGVASLGDVLENMPSLERWQIAVEAVESEMSKIQSIC